MAKTGNSNFDIIKAYKPYEYIFEGSSDDGGNHNGYIDLNVTVVDGLHIGSGFKQIQDKTVYSETIRRDGKAVIPGASLKGAVRHVARTVSDGCVPKEYIDRFASEFNLKCSNRKDGNRCIICDMFGMMGRKSKILFSDLVCENPEYEIKEMNAQFLPSLKNPIYFEQGSIKGYKLYRNKCAKYVLAQRELVEIVKRGSVFKGRLHFFGLTNSELNLLCFALGLGEDINIKIGGYKTEGIGQIKVRGEIMVNRKKETAKHFADSYSNDDTFARAITQVQETLKPYGGDAI